MTHPTRRELLVLATGAVLWPTAAQAMARHAFTLFGGPVELQLPVGVPAGLRDHVVGGLMAMNAQWNAWKPGELSRLNASLATGRPCKVSPALASMVRAAARLEVASGGCFNPAIGGLVGAWGFHQDVLGPGQRPAPSQLETWLGARPSLGQLTVRGPWIASPNRHLQLDFGAYAKGVAIDHVLDELQRHGVRDAMLNLSGNLATLGQAGGRPWRVGIRDPNGPGLLTMLETHAREAVVTSGSYERYRILDGERYTHIIDPTTGRPAREVVSVTVVHPSAALADAAATALLVAGPQRWRQVAERMGVNQVLVVDRAGRTEATRSLTPRLRAVA